MKKIINYRPLFYCFLAFALGIYFAKFIFSANISYIVLTLIGFSVITFLCVKFKCLKRLIATLCAFCIGLGVFVISFNSFNGKDYGMDEHVVSGRVIVCTDYDKAQRVILSNVYIDGDDAGNNISVYVYGSSDLEIGDIITYEASISTYNLFTFNKLNSYYYKYNIIYGSTTNVSDLSVDGKDSLTWSESLRISVKKILDQNMDLDAASVSYASLFGDKAYVSDEIRDSFSISGIAHLLAVSGLHVGFLVSFLTFILKRLKIKNVAKVCISGAILFAYCYLCSFSVSVIRASVMFLVLSLAELCGKQYDKLNSWSVAGFICLFYKPLSVFDGGFLLSFGSVLCIIMFSGTFNNVFKKIHMPKFLNKSLSAMLPVQFGLLPLISLYFSKFSLLSVFTNFICIPLFEIFFIMLFVMVILILVMPFLAFILKIPELIINFIINLSGFVSNVDALTINLFTIAGVVIIAIYVMFYICSHFVNLKIKKKTLSCVCIISIIMLLTLSSIMPAKLNDGSVAIINSYNKSVYNIELNNTNFTIGMFDSYAEELTETYLDNSQISKTDYLIYLNDREIGISEDKYSISYFCSLEESENSLTIGSVYVFNDIEVNLIRTGQNLAGIILSYDNTTVLICNRETFNFSTILEIRNNYDKIDLIFGDSKNIDLMKQEINVDYAVANGNNFYSIKENSSLNFDGNWSFNISDNKIENIRSLD